MKNIGVKILIIKRYETKTTKSGGWGDEANFNDKNQNLQIRHYSS